jgi:hypothetical protein
VARNQQQGSKGSRKLGRNFRRGGTSGSLSNYVISGGPGRCALRKARNCGCNKPINHSRENRAEHERERQMKALAKRTAVATA